MRLRLVNDAAVIGFRHGAALVCRQAAAFGGMTFAGGKIAQRPSDFLGCACHAPLAIERAQDRDADNSCLRDVGNGGGGRDTEIPDERCSGHFLGQLRSGRVHDKRVALLHFVDDQVGAHRVGSLPRVGAGVLEGELQVNPVSQTRKLVRAVAHVVAEGAERIAIKARRALAVDAVGAHRHVRQGMQPALPDFVHHLRRCADLAHQTLDVRHERRIDHLARVEVCHGPDLDRIAAAAHFTGKGRLIRFLLEAAERDHLSEIITHGGKQPAEARQWEVGPGQAVALEGRPQRVQAGLGSKSV